jgi:hypothetical protein
MRYFSLLFITLSVSSSALAGNSREAIEKAVDEFYAAYSNAQHTLKSIEPGALIPHESNELNLVQTSFVQIDAALKTMLALSLPKEISTY